MFGQPIQFNYAGEDSEYKSSCGAIFSLMINMVTLLYLVQQCRVLVGYRASSFTSYTIQSGLDPEYVHGMDDDFFFAIGIFDQFNPQTNYFDDMREFIEIRAELYSLDRITSEAAIEKITMTKCSEAQFDRLYPLDPTY